MVLLGKRFTVVAVVVGMTKLFIFLENGRIVRKRRRWIESEIVVVW